jgi:hypothetical protein
MNINNIDNIDMSVGYKNTDQYLEKINTSKQSLHFILQEFKKIYVLSRMYPENQEYQQQFSNVTNNLKTILANFFSLSNEVQLNIDEISKKMIELDILISKEREKNKKLKISLGLIENKNNASTEMINNYKEIYDMRYLRNWAIGLSTLVCIASISIVYKKEGV